MAGPNEQKLMKVQGARPGALRAAAGSWDTAAEGLAEVQRELGDVITRIERAWRAQSSEQAVAAFRVMQDNVAEYQGLMRDASRSLERGAQALEEGKSDLSSLPGVLPTPDAPSASGPEGVDVEQEVRYLKLLGAHRQSVSHREQEAGARYQKLVASLRDAQDGLEGTAPPGRSISGGGPTDGSGSGAGTPASSGGATSSPTGSASDPGPSSGSSSGSYSGSYSGGSVGAFSGASAAVIGGAAAGGAGVGAASTSAGSQGSGGRPVTADGAVDGVVAATGGSLSEATGEVGSSAPVPVEGAQSGVPGAGALAGGALGAGGLLGGGAGVNRALGGQVAPAGSRPGGAIGRSPGATPRAGSGVLGDSRSTTSGARPASGQAGAGARAAAQAGQSGSSGRAGSPGGQSAASRSAGARALPSQGSSSTPRTAGGAGSRAGGTSGAPGSGSGSGRVAGGASARGGSAGPGAAAGRGASGSRDDEQGAPSRGLVVEDEWLDDDEAGPGVIR